MLGGDAAHGRHRDRNEHHPGPEAEEHQTREQVATYVASAVARREKQRADGGDAEADAGDDPRGDVSSDVGGELVPTTSAAARGRKPSPASRAEKPSTVWMKIEPRNTAPTSTPVTPSMTTVPATRDWTSTRAGGREA